MLKEQIEMAKVSQNSMLEIVEKFTPLILKYAVMLHNPDAKQDLILDLITLIVGVDLTKVNTSEGSLVNYITKSIYHSYIRHSKRYKTENDYVELNPERGNTSDLAFSVEPDFWQSVRQALSAAEYKIVELIIVYGFSDAEIARMRGISRQAIGRMKNQAYCKLQRVLEAYVD